MVELGGSLWDRLADLAIPDDEVENYAEALEAGHSIVAYHGTSKSVRNSRIYLRATDLVKLRRSSFRVARLAVARRFQISWKSKAILSYFHTPHVLVRYVRRHGQAFFVARHGIRARGYA